MMRPLTCLVLFVGCALLMGQIAAQQPDPSALFKRGDTNKDGKLSFDEFSKLVGNSPKLKDKTDLTKKLFEKLDADGDGFLTLEEFKKIAAIISGGEKNDKKEPEAATVSKASGFADKPTQEQLAFFEKKIRPV